MNPKSWLQAANQRLIGLSSRVLDLAPKVVYTTLAAAPLLPLLHSASPAELQTAVVGVAGSLGGNLLANVLQDWRHHNQATLASGDDDAAIDALAAELSKQASANQSLRAALDQLLYELKAPQTVANALSPDDKAFFEQLFTRSQKAAGSQLTVHGDWVGGDKIMKDKVGRDKNKAKKITIINNPAPADPLAQQEQNQRNHYLSQLRKRCQVVPLAAMGGDEATGEDVTLDQVYVALDTTTPEPLSKAEKAARKKQNQFTLTEREETRPLTALEAASRTRRLVLLGDPGSGKSTFVQVLAATVAAWGAGENSKSIEQLRSLQWQPGLLPIVILLRDLAARLATLDLSNLSEKQRSEQWVQAIYAQIRADLTALRSADFIKSLEKTLLSGEVILILDGLDEVPYRQRTMVRQALLAFLGNSVVDNCHNVQRVIVTCRVRSYVGDTELPGFTPYTLEKFTKEQINAFVEAWYWAQEQLGRLRDQQTRQDRIASLQRAANGAELRRLSNNPMLLTTMAIIHQREAELPRERVRLYDLAVKVLLQRWQKHKELPQNERLNALLADDRKLREVVERIAYEAHSQAIAEEARQNAKRKPENQGGAPATTGDLALGRLLTLLKQPEYLGDLTLATDFIEYIDQRAGLVVGRGGSASQELSYAFPHRTFQEYLAGCYLIGQRSVKRAYQAHLEEGDGWELAAQLGGEELYYIRRNNPTLLDLIYDLCPTRAPTNKNHWRALLWSAKLAVLFPLREIETDSGDKTGGSKYLDRLRTRLVKAVSEVNSPYPPLERAEAGRCLGKLGDGRKGVGVISPGKVSLNDFDWIEIPAGPFIMGSDPQKDKDAFGSEQLQFTCTLIKQPYYISRYPVTVAQFARFIEAGGYQNNDYWTDAGLAWRNENGVTEPEKYGGNFEIANHPQVGVSWHEAVAYCHFLTALCKGTTGKTAGFSGIIRLPTEAEWERASRHTDGRIYPWQGDWDEKKCTNGRLNLGSTSAVGIFPSGNAVCGAADMSGNVWEWCGTQWLDNYIDYEALATESLKDGKACVVRGGSWDSHEQYLRCARRLWDDRLDRFNYLGFRVVSPGC